MSIFFDVALHSDPTRFFLAYLTHYLDDSLLIVSNNRELQSLCEGIWGYARRQLVCHRENLYADSV